jgi:hypothetical protein
MQIDAPLGQRDLHDPVAQLGEIELVLFARSSESAPMRSSARDCGSVASHAPAPTGELTLAADQSLSPGP